MTLRSALGAITAKFRRSNPPASAPAPVVAAVKPRQPEPDLVGTLLGEHKQLRALMKGILDEAKRKSFDRARARLSDFETLVDHHLGFEDRNLYAALKRELPSHAGNVQRCQAELEGVRRELRLVAQVCPAQGPWPSNALVSMSKLFDRLKERLSYEEMALFPVYRALGDDREITDKTQIFDRSFNARLKANGQQRA